MVGQLVPSSRDYVSEPYVSLFENVIFSGAFLSQEEASAALSFFSVPFLFTGLRALARSGILHCYTVHLYSAGTEIYSPRYDILRI